MIHSQSLPKVALIHDHLNQFGGAEQVLLALAELWPDAPIYTITYDREGTRGMFDGMDIRTSFIQKLPFGVKRYKWYLPLMPSAFEQFDLSRYDIVISDSSAFAKGVITQPETMHLTYCHTPTRYLWSDHFDYIRDIRGPAIVRKAVQFMSTALRVWDRMAAERVNVFVANSEFVGRRIKKYYRRDSEVIYPPVDVSDFSVSEDAPGDYFLVVSRLRPYKRVDLVIEACNRLKLPLKVVGGGEEERRLRAMAGPTIEFLGSVSDERKAQLLAGCRAFINPQEEDFGIAPVEAMAAGRPVVAYGRGGARESILDGETGVFFSEQTVDSLVSVLSSFDDAAFDPHAIREHAEKFSREAFMKAIRERVEIAYASHLKEFDQ